MWDQSRLSQNDSIHKITLKKEPDVPVHLGTKGRIEMTLLPHHQGFQLQFSHRLKQKTLMSSLFFLLEHPFFVGVQYHPEFLSRPIKPSPPYFGLLLASAGRLTHYLQKGCRLSPR